MFQGEVPSKNIHPERKESVADFQDKLKAMKQRVTSFIAAGKSEETLSPLNLQGLDNANLIPQENNNSVQENRNKAEIWLEKRLKVAEEEAQLTSVFTNLTSSSNNNSNWIIKTRDGRSMEIDPYDLFQKYFPDIDEDRKNIMIGQVYNIMYNVKVQSEAEFLDRCEYKYKVKLENKVSMSKLPLLTIFELEDSDYNKLTNYDDSVASMFNDEHLMVVRKDYGNDIKFIKHEYQHRIYHILNNFIIKQRTELMAKRRRDEGGNDTTKSIDINETFYFKDEIIAYLADGSDAENLKYQAHSDLYNYRKVNYESKLVSQDENSQLEPEIAQSYLEYNANLTEEYNKISDRTNYLIEIDKLIDIAFEVRDLIKIRYSNENNKSQFGIPDLNLIFPETNNFDDYEINLITASLLRDTSTENWYKLVGLLKSVAEKEALEK